MIDVKNSTLIWSGILILIFTLVLGFFMYPPESLVSDDAVQVTSVGGSEDIDGALINNNGETEIKVKMVHGFNKSDFNIKIYYIDKVLLSETNEIDNYNIHEIKTITGTLTTTDVKKYNVNTGNSKFMKVETISYNSEIAIIDFGNKNNIIILITLILVGSILLGIGMKRESLKENRTFFSLIILFVVSIFLLFIIRMIF